MSCRNKEIIMNFINYILLNGNPYYPLHATTGAAGYDLCSTRAVSIEPYSQVKLDLNIAFEIPCGFYGLLTSRSSYAALGIICQTGIIDSDYRGSIKAIAYNCTNEVHQLGEGIRFCQIIFMPCAQFSLNRVNELSNTVRQFSGFGSTGNTNKAFEPPNPVIKSTSTSPVQQPIVGPSYRTCAGNTLTVPPSGIFGSFGPSFGGFGPSRFSMINEPINPVNKLNTASTPGVHTILKIIKEKVNPDEKPPKTRKLKQMMLDFSKKRGIIMEPGSPLEEDKDNYLRFKIKKAKDDEDN